MASQELQFTAVPYDAEERNGETWLSVAICLTPRLQDTTTDDNKLNEYPDFVDWPTALQSATFELDINGTIVPASDLVPKDEQPDSEVWKAVFKPTTLVRPFEYIPFTNFQIISFNTGKVQTAVNATLQKLVKDFDGVPPVLDSEFNASDSKLSAQVPKLFQSLADIVPNADTEATAKSLLDKWENEGQQATLKMIRDAENPQKKESRRTVRSQVQVPSNPESMVFKPFNIEPPAASLVMAEVFHAARSIAVDNVVNGKKIARGKRAPIKKPSYDFHQIVSVLREYPLMMRKLGLVMHVEFRKPAGIGVNSRIRCKVNWPLPPKILTNIVTPWTAYNMNLSGPSQYWQFLPRPDADSEIVGSVLCLNNASHFTVTQLDVDTAAMKALNYVRGIRHRYMKTVGTKDVRASAEPPTTRGTGLQLVRVNRGLKLAKMLIRNSQNWNKLVTNAPIELYADDLLRGYRIDVYDETAGTWQSLMRRNATYTFPNASEPLKSTGLSITDEEGVLTMGATRAPGSESNPAQQQLYAHETVAQWEGWSLVAPLIGQHIDTNDHLAPSPEKQSPPADFDYQVETAVSIVPGSLPRLRYGRRYRMRARFVDIAGNGAKYNELNPADFSCATELVRYLRWDPIASPTLALRTHPVEGESMEKVVIRNYNADDDDSVEVPTTETRERHVFPPLASVQTAERHGLFDTSPVGAMKGDLATYNMIRNKEGKLPQRWYTRSDSGDLVPEAADNVEPANAAKKKTAIAYPLVQSGATDTPYLPDPLARTLTLNKVPGIAAGQLMQIDTGGATMAAITSASGVVTIAFDEAGSWPNLTSILLKLAEGNGAPTWDAATKTLTIFLPKGEQAWIDFSSGLGDNQAEADTNLDLHGHKKTLTDAGQSAGKIAAAARGLSWLISPARTLHLIHATQKPLKKPKVNAVNVAVRNFGATNADINIPDTYVHARTTQKIDMFAEWPMWVDDLNKDKPELLQQSAYFYDQHSEDRTKDKLEAYRTQEFGDTKFRLVTYVPLATTRFREHMPITIRNNKDLLTRKGTGKEVKVLNTKRPDSVNLLYVIPSFRWVEPEKKLTGNVIKSTRKGGGLRVYMQRPWFSSGNGELLGVVLYSTEKFTPSANKNDGKGGGLQILNAPLDTKSLGVKGNFEATASLLGGGKLEIPEQLTGYVTQWGLDPITLSAPTPSDNSPRIANFREPKLVLPSVSLEEVDPKQRFSVVAYEPKFDEERKLWYCDIELDPGASYYPFVRLALVRVQPDSLKDSQTGKDVFCSRVSQSTFCQLAPDREATARIDADGESVTIQVVGHTYRTNSVGQMGSEIEVALEKRDAAAGNTDLGWTRIKHQRLDRIHAANLWGGTITVDGGVSSAKYRIVITEVEEFFADPEKPQDRMTSLGSQKTGDGEIRMETSRRIVYADVLELF